jgi:hypothetical protein
VTLSRRSEGFRTTVSFVVLGTILIALGWSLFREAAVMQRDAARFLEIAQAWIPTPGTGVPETAVRGVQTESALVLLTANSCPHCDASARVWNVLMPRLDGADVWRRVVKLDISTDIDAGNLELPAGADPEADDAVLLSGAELRSFGVAHTAFLPLILLVDVNARQVRGVWPGSFGRVTADTLLAEVSRLSKARR